MFVVTRLKGFVARCATGHASQDYDHYGVFTVQSKGQPLVVDDPGREERWRVFVNLVVSRYPFNGSIPKLVAHYL